MKVILILALIALVVVPATALKAKKLTSGQQTRIQEIKKGNTWGGILLNLAELHTMAKGPLDELVAAIQDTVADLQYKRERRDEAYVQRTNEHNALVTKLEADIANAEADIESILDLLEILREQKEALEEENRQKTASNVALRADIVAKTAIRVKQHALFEEQVQETEEAVAVVEECLTILNEFATGGASFAQAQVKKVKILLQETSKKVSKINSVEGSFLNALIAVASNQEFADNGAVLQVIAKFNEIKNNFYNSIGQLNATEAQNQAEFEQFVSDSKAEIAENQSIIAYNNELLEQNAQNTEENTNLLAQRRQDKVDFEQALDDENVSFEEATVRYLAWCAENDREVAVCNEALEVVATVDFAGYIGDRVNAEDGLVSSGMATSEAHGQGTEVFNFDYQL